MLLLLTTLAPGLLVSGACGSSLWQRSHTALPHWRAATLRAARTAASMNFLDDIKELAGFSKDYPPATVESAITRVKFSTSAGNFTVQLDRALSPIGVDHFLQLVRSSFFEGQLLYRVVPGFLVQFGVAADPMVMSQWKGTKLPDEPNRASFRRGTLSYAGNGPNSRACHVFLALERESPTSGFK